MGEVERKIAEMKARPLAEQLAEAIEDANIMQAGLERALVLLREWRDCYCWVKPVPPDWEKRFETLVGPVTPEQDPYGRWPR